MTVNKFCEDCSKQGKCSLTYKKDCLTEHRQYLKKLKEIVFSKKHLKEEKNGT